jgi:hypothetical protein
MSDWRNKSPMSAIGQQQSAAYAGGALAAQRPGAMVETRATSVLDATLKNSEDQLSMLVAKLDRLADRLLPLLIPEPAPSTRLPRPTAEETGCPVVDTLRNQSDRVANMGGAIDDLMDRLVV